MFTVSVFTLLLFCAICLLQFPVVSSLESQPPELLRPQISKIASNQHKNFQLNIQQAISAFRVYSGGDNSDKILTSTISNAAYVAFTFYDVSNKSNSTCNDEAVTFKESVATGICYPSSAALTSYYLWSLSASGNVTLNVFSDSLCTTFYSEGFTGSLGCAASGNYSISSSTSFTWGKSSGFGITYYADSNACSNHDGSINGGYFVPTSSSGCFSTSAMTSTQVYCASLQINFKYFSTPDCTGGYNLDTANKNSLCSQVQYYELLYGYPYYDCFKLGKSTRAPTKRPTKKPTKKPSAGLQKPKKEKREPFVAWFKSLLGL